MTGSTTPWRDTWDAADPQRVCYTCGEPPTSTFRDGSPKYDCPTGPHQPIYATGTRQPSPTRITVTLSAVQLAQAEAAAHWRVAERARRGLTRRQNQEGIDPALAWEQEVNGTAGELAASVALGLAWDGRRFDGADLPPDIEVRTGPRPTDHLIVFAHEVGRARRFLLVLGQRPTFVVVGWLHGRDAKREEWWRSYRGPGGEAYFVPQAALRPPRELMR